MTHSMIHSTSVTRETVAVECWQIDAAPLDTIHVFWMDVIPGKGHVTITCYGQAWTAYFGAMSGQSIREFFAGCDIDYLSTKLGIAPNLKLGQQRTAYLGSIITAVQKSIAAEPQGGSR